MTLRSQALASAVRPGHGHPAREVAIYDRAFSALSAMAILGQRGALITTAITALE
jgi:hypothetical protein